MENEIRKIEQLPEMPKPGGSESEPVRESPELKREPAQERPPAPPVLPPTPPPTTQPAAAEGHSAVSHDKLLSGIERILEENLTEAYQGLPPDMARAFKDKGQETAVTIRDLVSRARVKVRAIVRLISEWLKMLPGVNRFFLVQESKLKTDKILSLAAREQKK